MNNKTIWTVIGVIVIVVLLIIGNKSIQQDFRIKIGVITALTGSGTATYGDPLKKGIDLAIKEIDPNNSKYDVLYEDYQLDTKQALPAYTKLKSEGVKIFIIDGSPALSVVTPEIRKEGYMSFNTSSFVPSYKDGSPLTCRMAITTDNYGPAYADLLINKLHIKKVVTLIPNYESGVALARAFKTAYEAAGGTIVGQEMYAKDATDFRTNITKLQSYKDADGILAVNWFSSATSMFQQMKELGLSNQIVTDDWTTALVDKALLNNAYFIGYNFTFASPNTDKGKNFFAEYNSVYGTTPAINAVQSYDLIGILNTAINGTNSSQPSDIAKYITTKLGTYSGVGGNISFNSDCEAQRDIVIGHIVNGQVVE